MTKPDSASLTLVDPSKPIDLAKVEAGQIRNVANFDSAELGERAKAMIDHINALDHERAQKAILAGIYLHQVKLSLPHGEFGVWMEKHLCNSCTNPVSRRTAYNVMLLAEKFCRSAKLYLPELVASQQLSLKLEAPAGAAQAFKAKLVKFVGHHGLTELYQRHGVIRRGGKREKPSAPATPEETPTNLNPAAVACQQMVDAINDCERIMLAEECWAELRPDQIENLVAPLVKRFAERFRNRLLQAKHESA